MKYSFCTLFDSGYLARGLCMYESLIKHCSTAHLYIFAFDQKTYEVLETLALKNATIIPLDQFEDESLLKAKKERTWREYCWTCTPSIILHSINSFNIEHCIYLDADLYFYESPRVLLEELKEKSILLTEHNYSKKYNQTENSGKYCVQFMFFKNDKKGIKALIWWRDRCLEWCYAYHENGKFGDQKYLDDWLTRFEGIHVLKHLGGGVAPWNIQKFDINEKNDGISLIDIEKNSETRLVFFHFHHLTFHYFNYLLFGFRVCRKRVIEESKYQHYFLNNKVKELLYKPYIQRLINIEAMLAEQFPGNVFNNGPTVDLTLITYLKKWLN